MSKIIGHILSPVSENCQGLIDKFLHSILLTFFFQLVMVSDQEDIVWNVCGYLYIINNIKFVAYLVIDITFGKLEVEVQFIVFMLFGKHKTSSISRE